MKHDKLDKLLEELRREPLPVSPANLEDRVRREIRRADAKADNSALENWLDLLFSRSIACAAVIFLMALGAGLIVGSATSAESPWERIALIDHALHLKAFKADGSRLDLRSPAL